MSSLQYYEHYLETGDRYPLGQLAELAPFEDDALELLMCLCKNMEDEDFDGKRHISGYGPADPVALRAMADLLRNNPKLKSKLRRMMEGGEEDEFFDLTKLLRKC